MAQGEFTKEEADATMEAIKEVVQELSRKKKMELIGHFNDIGLFIEAAKRAAPTEAEFKAKKQLGAHFAAWLADHNIDPLDVVAYNTAWAEFEAAQEAEGE